MYLRVSCRNAWGVSSTPTMCSFSDFFLCSPVLPLWYRQGKFHISSAICFLEAVTGRGSVKKGVLKNFANFTGKHLWWSLFLIKLQALRPGALLKRSSNTGVFLWSLQNFWRIPILKKIYKRLLLVLLSRFNCISWFKFGTGKY